MKHYRFLHNVILMALLSTVAHANSNGFYIGADTTIVNFGKEDLTITNKDKSEKKYKDIDASHCNIKVGYQHFDKNRIEFYYRNNQLDSKGGNIETKTFGINYEWAFSSLATETITPYLLIGIGGGEATSKKRTEVDKAEVGEGNLGVGIHYQVTPNTDIQLGYTITSTGFDNFDNDTTDKTSTIDQNKIILGVAYKF